MLFSGLNLFKNYTKDLFANVNHCNPEQKTQILDTIRSTCKSVTDARPHELRGGQWPYDPIENHGTFTAEELQLFVLWMLPYILNKISKVFPDNRRLMLGRLLVDIGHYLFVITRKKGWSMNDVEVVRKLLQQWRILSEDIDGSNGRPLEHVAGVGHILEDIIRFGHSAVYWCYPYERAIWKFLNIPTNKKGVESTYMKNSA
jgi:hypothetical protein